MPSLKPSLARQATRARYRESCCLYTASSSSCSAFLQSVQIKTLAYKVFLHLSSLRNLFRWMSGLYPLSRGGAGRQ